MFAHSSGGQESEIEVFIGLASSGACQGGSPPCFPPRFWGLLQSLAFLGWQMHPSDLYLWLHMVFAVRPFLFSSLIRTLVIGFRAHLNSSRSFSQNPCLSNIGKDPFSK